MFLNQNAKRLTIEDIETKQFRLVARGYEQREVDEFLDSICDEIELMQNEMADLKRKLNMAGAENRKAEAASGFVRPAAMEAMEDAPMREVLEMAQRVKEQTIADAQVKAQEILDNAETEATARLGGLTEEKERLEKMVVSCEKEVRQIEQRLTEGDNRLELMERYLSMEHLSREVVEILIDHIVVYKRIPGTHDVPIEIHWNF